MSHIDPIKEEERKLRRLRFIVDLTVAVLMQGDISLQDALKLVSDTKEAALSLFPDKEDVYELIYTPRFRRIIAERFGMPGTISGRN